MSLTWPRIESTVRTRTYMMSKLVTSASPAANGGTLGSYQRWEPPVLAKPPKLPKPPEAPKGGTAGRGSAIREDRGEGDF